MTFTWPQSLHPLRDFMKKHGVEHDRHATARQAAFFAQQIVGSRIKFPPPGSDMTSTLFLIQKAIEGWCPNGQQDGGRVVVTQPSEAVASKHKKAKGKGVGKANENRVKPGYLTAFSRAAVSSGYHVFADGACVPNPGPGGWGMVVYKDGEEIASDSGGEPSTTNNRMEIAAMVAAVQWAIQYPEIKVSIWSDSQYVVNGVNDWRHGWKRNGWQRGSAKAEPKNRHLANADLWIAIDEALSSPRATNVTIAWVKGHAGHIGNERADELAEIGRQGAKGEETCQFQDLDAEYRQVMAG